MDIDDIKVVQEPPDMMRCPAEACVDCRRPTRTWLGEHTPLCQECCDRRNRSRVLRYHLRRPGLTEVRIDFHETDGGVNLSFFYQDKSGLGVQLRCDGTWTFSTGPT